MGRPSRHRRLSPDAALGACRVGAGAVSGEVTRDTRASAQFDVIPVEDPTFYQQFFAAYSKPLFLEAHEVDPATPGGLRQSALDAQRLEARLRAVELVDPEEH